MTYNIHPLVVHFPIALLLVYSFIKILPLAKYFPNVAWKHIERALLVFGVLGAFASLSTGEIAEELVNPNRKLVETHAFFANFSTWIYGLLLAGEILSYLNVSFIPRLQTSIITKLTFNLERLLTHPILSKVLAFVGFLAISLTGMLGGVMVYGLSADPLAPIVMQILGL